MGSALAYCLGIKGKARFLGAVPFFPARGLHLASPPNAFPR